jgi:hypothetical protein
LFFGFLLAFKVVNSVSLGFGVYGCEDFFLAFLMLIVDVPYALFTGGCAAGLIFAPSICQTSL